MAQTDNKNNNKKEEWVPIYKKRLGDAINFAKGRQSMAEFARKCGLNPMTLSRAVNGTIKKPLDEETIRVMAECSDFPTEEILEDLMRANGWVKNNDEERRLENERRSQERKDRYDLAQGIIMRTLFEDGYTIIPVINTELEELDPTLKKSRYRLHTNVRFALRLKGYEPAFWNFSVNIFTGKEFDVDKKQYARELRSELSIMTEAYKDVFLRDVWESEAFENSLYSIVFLSGELFEGFFDQLKDLKFNNSFSLILLDPDRQKVVEERFLPRRDGAEYKSLFKSTDRGDQ